VDTLDGDRLPSIDDDGDICDESWDDDDDDGNSD
jgi:hypothetical protein